MTKTYHMDDDETPSEAIINALSTVTNDTELNAQPLYNSIDPESLDDLFSSPSTCYRVTFNHAGYRITAHRTGDICVKEIEQE